MHVGQLAAGERIQVVRLRVAVGDDAAVDFARLVVLAAVVVGHAQVERGLGVVGVDAERGLERVLGVLEAALGVIDDAEHVVDVGERRTLGHRLGQIRLRLVVLVGVIVLAAEADELLQAVRHSRRPL
jgi:hypothetical protein